MSLKIETVNLCDGFSDERRIPDIFEEFEEIQPDIAVFPEAYKEGEERYLDDVKAIFDQQGYVAVQQLYNDADNRQDRHGLIIAARHELALAYEPVRLAMSRSALQLLTYDPETEAQIDFYGVHFKDRPAPVRYEEAASLLEYVDPDRAAVVAGDFNNMKRSGRATVLRAMGHVAGKFPQHEPGTPKPAKMMSRDGFRYVPARLASLFSRLGEMARGDVIDAMMESGFYDDDQDHSPTMSNKFPVAKIDLVVARKLRVHDQTTRKNRYTDHRTLVASVSSVDQ
jgi:endonuclease/exonuclease/phosphatase family metal-dependent hydrolase